jgi:hypothetical protein
MTAVTAPALPRGLSLDPRSACAEQVWLVHYVAVGQQLLALATGEVWAPGALDQARALTAAQLPYERPDWVSGCDEIGELWALFGLYDPIDDDELPVPDPSPARVRSAAWDLLGEVAYDLDVRFGDLPGPNLDGDLDPVAVTQLAVLAATVTAVLAEARRDAEQEAAAEAGEQGRPAAVWTSGAPVVVGGLPSAGKSALAWALAVTAALDAAGGVR